MTPVCATGLDQPDGSVAVHGRLARRAAAGTRAGGEHGRVGAAQGIDETRIVAFEIAEHRRHADGLEVGGVIGVADDAADVVTVGPRSSPSSRAICPWPPAMATVSRDGVGHGAMLIGLTRAAPRVAC